MSTVARTSPAHACRGAAAIAAALVAISLGACHGGTSTEPDPATAATTAVAADAPPLFDGRGLAQPSPSARVPVAIAERTRAGLYATPAQYEWQALTMAPYTVLLDVDALGSEQAAVEEAEPARGAPGVAFFVRARVPGRAAMVADRLGDSGIAPVFVVR